MKSESEIGKTSYGAVLGKSRPMYMYLLLAGNDTVPISVWRGVVCALLSAV